jgi:hypothetical protein
VGVGDRVVVEAKAHVRGLAGATAVEMLGLPVRAKLREYVFPGSNVTSIDCIRPVTAFSWAQFPDKAPVQRG